MSLHADINFCILLVLSNRKRGYSESAINRFVIRHLRNKNLGGLHVDIDLENMIFEQLIKMEQQKVIFETKADTIFAPNVVGWRLKAEYVKGVELIKKWYNEA
jgi:hypothetical protein